MQESQCRSEIPEYLRIIAKPVVDAIIGKTPMDNAHLLSRSGGIVVRELTTDDDGRRRTTDYDGRRTTTDDGRQRRTTTDDERWTIYVFKISVCFIYF